MSHECIFCKIAEGKIPAKIIYQDTDIVAFHDINPQAPVHFLIIPRKHLKNLLDVKDVDAYVLAKMLMVASDIAGQLNIANEGYRVVINTNRQAGQSVDHLHIHVLGGRTMEWPPG
ncbi:MAG: histidine triad nucleotide-binding protein [Candidatus Omnitrophica bacterium]|nr:histidine triad nucleotide-binding protein [Candidatus Omnitrophota bacterium]